MQNSGNNFLEIILQRIEDTYLHDRPGDFSDEFTADFEAFLASVDLDADTEGNQPYTDPDDIPILTLEDTQWFGPPRTWPKELANYPYIHFWHRLDDWLEAEDIREMGPELLGEKAWKTLFSTGPLVENPEIYMSLSPYRSWVEVELTDQNGIPRPANTLSDIGAYEYYSPPCFGNITEDRDSDGSDLAAFAAEFDLGTYTGDDLSTFADHFGRTDCS